MRLVPFTADKSVSYAATGTIKYTVWINPEQVVSVEQVITGGKVNPDRTTIYNLRGSYIVNAKPHDVTFALQEEVY